MAAVGAICAQVKATKTELAEAHGQLTDLKYGMPLLKWSPSTTSGVLQMGIPDETMAEVQDRHQRMIAPCPAAHQAKLLIVLRSWRQRVCCAHCSPSKCKREGCLGEGQPESNTPAPGWLRWLRRLKSGHRRLQGQSQVFQPEAFLVNQFQKSVMGGGSIALALLFSQNLNVCQWEFFFSCKFSGGHKLSRKKKKLHTWSACNYFHNTEVMLAQDQFLRLKISMY